MQHLPKLYTELADWWPVLSAPEDYAEEAAFYRKTILSAATSPPQTLLELGSGGGNNASHLKPYFEMTLVDLSPGMLAVSRALNPECEHRVGDMRTVRLHRQYDAVFIHDAIDHIQTLEDLGSTIHTAYVHCKPGGLALFAPDNTIENYKPTTSHGGHDRGNRSLRYLQWDLPLVPGSNTYTSFMVYALREGTAAVRTVEDRFVCGLFSTETWFQLLQATGFQPRAVPFEHSEVEPGTCTLFVGLKPTP